MVETKENRIQGGGDRFSVHFAVTFIICIIVYNLYYCCYAKTSSSAVQKHHSKVYGKPIPPS